MRALKIATIVMGVLIVVGTMTLIIGLARRASAPGVASCGGGELRGGGPGGVERGVANLPPSVAAVLDEPVGTRIRGIAVVRDRLAVRLEGGGLDRVVLIDPVTGAVAGRISLAR